MALLGDMQLETVLGPLKIRTLADKSAADSEFKILVFVWTGSRPFFAEASEFRPRGLEQVFDVELDDGETVQVSASSKFIMKAGDPKMAPELAPDDSLLPLYKGFDGHNYPTDRVPVGQPVSLKMSRLMAEWKQDKPLVKGTYVEHIDGDRSNYHPDNLKITVDELRAKRSRKPKMVLMVADAQKLFDECAAASPKMAKIAESGSPLKRHRRKKKKTNHKVVMVTPGPLGEVYTASVRSDYSVSVSGVFLTLPA